MCTCLMYLTDAYFCRLSLQQWRIAALYVGGVEVCLRGVAED